MTRIAPSRAALLALLTFMLTLTHGAAHAQSSELESLLEQPIVSTPSKQSETATTAPATSTIITAEQLRTYGIRSLDEAVNYLSLGMVTTNPLHGVEIGARGVLLTSDYGNHVLLLIDGVPVNEPWNGTAYFERGAGVPFELVDHIEVILGPGSVMYGSQAMLGVINIVTKRARDHAGLRVLAEGDTSLPVARNGTIETSPLSAYGFGSRVGAGYGKELTLFGKPSELTLQLEYYEEQGQDWQLGPQNGDLDAVTGKPKSWGPRSLAPGVWGGTTHDSYYTLAPAAYARLSIGDVVATLRGSLYQRATPYLDSIVNSGGDFDDPKNHERDRFLEASLSHHAALSSHAVLGTRVYGELYDYEWLNRRSAAEECPAGYANGCQRDLMGGGGVGGAEMQLTYSAPELRTTTLLGIDSRLRRVASELDLSDLASGMAGAPQNVYTRTDALIAPYLEQSWSPLSWLDLNAGLRFDYDTHFGGKLSPRAAVGIAPWNAARLKLIYAEAFRAPTAFEVSYSDPADQIAAPRLGPESVRSVEASMEQRFGAHRLFFGVFRSWWFDMVGYRTLSTSELSAATASGAISTGGTEAFQYANFGTIDNYGYNAGYDGAALDRKLRFGLTLTEAYTRRAYSAGSEPLPVSPSLFGNAHASYAFGEDPPTVALAAHFVARRLADRALDGGFATLPYAPPDLELRTTVTGNFPGIARLSYRASFSYAFANRGPYVIGPNQYASDATTPVELSPIKRLQGFLGLEYLIF